MEKFDIINNEDLELINGGDAVDIALGVGSFVAKGATGAFLGVFGLGKTIVDTVVEW